MSASLVELLLRASETRLPRVLVPASREVLIEHRNRLQVRAEIIEAEIRRTQEELSER